MGRLSHHHNDAVLRPLFAPRRIGMLGFSDGWIAFVFLATIATAVLCIVYGFLNWNKGDAKLSKTDREWAEEEKVIEKELE